MFLDFRCSRDDFVHKVVQSYFWSFVTYGIVQQA